MAITNYGELKTNVASFIHRSDLTSLIPTFIALGEAQIRRDVRCRGMETVASGTLTTANTLAQPTGYIEARRLTLSGDVYYYVTPEVFSELTDASSTAHRFTNIGTDINILNAAVGDAYVLTYWKMFTALSGDTDTNWLLTNAPEVYLWSACVQGAAYMLDDAAAQRYVTLYQAAVNALNAGEKTAAVSGSALAVRPHSNAFL